MASQKTSANAALTSSSGDPAKLPPHALEAEQSVIGGLLLDPEAWDRIAGHVSEKDFYNNDHRLLFRTIATLEQQNNPVDILTVTNALKVQGELEKLSDITYLATLANNTPTIANIKAYADIVRDCSILRQMLAAAQTIGQSVFDTQGRSVRALLEEAERHIFSIAENRPGESEPISIGDILPKANDRLEDLKESGGGITGLATGFTDLDEMTSGLQEGELVLIAGRPSMGKTSFAMNIIEHIALRGINSKTTTVPGPALVFSLEMPSDMLVMRMLSSLSGINQQKLRKGQFTDADWEGIAKATSKLSQTKIFIDDTAALSPTELRARARRIARAQGDLSLIVIDYLQLMHMSGKVENRTLEISEISRSLKILAKELNVPVIALSQLNRGLEQRRDRRPAMSDLRDSGALEQDADVILFIYRDEVYEPKSPDKGTAEIIISKQRNGPTGMVRLTFRGECTRFDNFSGERIDAVSAVPSPHSFHDDYAPIDH